jgi:hypothetical protein
MGRHGAFHGGGYFMGKWVGLFLWIMLLIFLAAMQVRL